MKIDISQILPWIKYLFERTSPLITFPLIIGYSISAALITKGYVELFPFVVTTVLVFYTIFYLRLKNDFDDFEKDSVAFPTRPLPRGLITRYDAQEVIHYLEYILAGLLGIIFIFYPIDTRLAALLTGGYLWLMAKKFYLPRWERRSPLLRAILNQAFLIPLTFLIVAIWSPPKTFSLVSLSYTSVVFGAFFVNNLCRKLDPFEHPAALSFIHYYGFHFSYYVAIAGLLLSAAGAYGLGLGLWLWPCEAGVLFFLTRLFEKPKQFHIAKIAALCSLFLHVWAGVYRYLLQ